MARLSPPFLLPQLGDDLECFLVLRCLNHTACPGAGEGAMSLRLEQQAVYTQRLLHGPHRQHLERGAGWDTDSGPLVRTIGHTMVGNLNNRDDKVSATL